ncbi:MAG: type II secretion system F family protein [Thermodesulfobacteriota bacterium]|nr:type II secretion system F family protein [Thermodesulfobacteriota bacterium]
MPLYHYKAIDLKGKTVKGAKEETSPDVLAQDLRKEGLMIIAIKEKRQRSKEKTGKSSFLQQLKNKYEKISIRVKPNALLLFTSQLSTMLGAGLQLVRSLSGLAADMGDKKFKAIIENIKKDVEEGSPLNEALSRYPGIFNNLFVNLVKAGELSGELDTVLGHITIHLEKTVALKQKVKSAIIYPLILISFTILAVMFLLLKVIPIFDRVFSRFNTELPLPTSILLTVSNTIREHFDIFFIASIISCLLIFLFIKTDKGRLVFDIFQLKMPIFGSIIKKAALARFARTLGLMVESGIPILESLEVASNTSDNKVIEYAVSNSITQIRDGGGIAETLKKSAHFPELVTQMITTGEESGKLSFMLQKTAEYYENQVDASVNILSSLIEPILVIIMGALIGSILICMFLPIFMLGRAIR